MILSCSSIRQTSAGVRLSEDVEERLDRKSCRDLSGSENILILFISFAFILMKSVTTELQQCLLTSSVGHSVKDL